MPAPKGKCCTIIGGPNGSGKSTIFELLKPPGTFVNADTVARRLAPEAPESASMAAGRMVLATLGRMVGDGASFTYETTLSSRQSIALMELARASGYEVDLVFVALESADLNVKRVADRVRLGGHDIPEPVIRRRYDAALRRLPEAVRLADGCVFFDNSHIRPTMILSVQNGAVSESRLDAETTLHRRIAEAVAQGLGIDAATLLATP